MARPREDLHEIFRDIFSKLGIEDLPEERHVYFRKPSSLMNYPCILYDLSSRDSISADNVKFINYNRYTVTVIDEDPDSEIERMVNDIPYAILDRTYQSDNLNHFVYTIYY